MATPVAVGHHNHNNPKNQDVVDGCLDPNP